MFFWVIIVEELQLQYDYIYKMISHNYISLHGREPSQIHHTIIEKKEMWIHLMQIQQKRNYGKYST